MLSRALEANKHSSELWLHYLGMFARRRDTDELLVMCKQGLNYAPSYELHWKYLTVLPTLSLKRAHCYRIEEYVTSAESGADESVTSHRTLEILYYAIQLLLLTGRTSAALQHMQVTS